MINFQCRNNHDLFIEVEWVRIIIFLFFIFFILLLCYARRNLFYFLLFAGQAAEI